jgi:rhodanese-related sulfurtransferase
MPLPGSMSVRELAEVFGRGEPVVVLDVREPHERGFAAIPVPASATDLHVPMGQVPARRDEIVEASGRGRVVVYCHLGVRSARVASWLSAEGIAQVVNLEGGIDAWSTDVDPSLPRY